ncbi:hypothetical protein [Calorimonas adulescens]|uniref:Uncharacterized protein n=1 Tax=Calorimonas adulescens TaxID=2606906 RepID=A0A5D8QDX1_9THEO|nr:hypothetical protein [Calorimonas adulescens]TZE81458.1 hypothetical protein FWJ32_08920 [Calorimonas adulescens]
MIPTIFLKKNEIIESELQNDVLYERLKDVNIDKYTSFAWDRGDRTALRIKEINPDINYHITKNNLSVIIDDTIFNNEYLIFSEYAAVKNTIYIYRRCINEEFIPAIPEKYKEWRDFEKLRNVFICHEYYHHLEINDIGLTAELKKIEVAFGLFKVKRKIKALNEIAAHAFTKRFLDIN